jgi:nucleoside 2-deoxyribosyltransferase
MNHNRIYLAGPDVFLADAAAFAAAKRELCARYGFIGVSPFDNEVEIATLPKNEAARQISAANEAMIRKCDLMIANLTPFRGPSADVGTVYEMGFARALGKPVFAYTNVAGSFVERTREALSSQVRKRASGQFEDAFHMAIEDFDRVDNLMVDGAVTSSGAHIVVRSTPDDRRFTDLTAFEECLQLAQRLIGASQPRPRRRKA